MKSNSRIAPTEFELRNTAFNVKSSVHTDECSFFKTEFAASSKLNL
jgi:hypothetical protein